MKRLLFIFTILLSLAFIPHKSYAYPYEQYHDFYILEHSSYVYSGTNYEDFFVKDVHGGYLYAFMDVDYRVIYSYGFHCPVCSQDSSVFRDTMLDFCGYIEGFDSRFLRFDNNSDPGQHYLHNFFGYYDDYITALNNGVYDFPSDDSEPTPEPSPSYSFDWNGNINIPDNVGDLVSFDYLKDLPDVITIGDLYVLLAQLFNLILFMSWMFIIFKLLDFAFINLNKLHYKGK